MERYVPELDALYSGRRHIEITDPVEIHKQAISHTGACWGSGTPLELGYVQLYDPSTYRDGFRTVFVCKKAAYAAASTKE